MKRILVVEDDGKVYKMIKQELDSSSYEVERVKTVAEAIGAIEEASPFDCYVVDLSILALGLSLEEMDKYHRFEGFAFLKNYLWKGTDDRIKELKRKTIICSRWVNELRQQFGNEVDGLKMVLKNKGFEKTVASYIKDIS